MSARRDADRRGVALLMTVVIIGVCGVGVLALWQLSAGLQRSAALDVAAARARSLADSALRAGYPAISDGTWRTLTAPGASLVTATGTAPRGSWRTELGRSGWSTLLLRASATLASGVRGVPARGDRRVLVPLVAPLDVPFAALTGVAPWAVPPAALVEVPPAAGAEVVCRGGVTPTAMATWGGAPALASIDAVPIDADTVTGPLTGVFRLTNPNLTHPLFVVGMVVLDSELLVQADLELVGVLVTRGAIQHAGGRLQVTGAVLAGDAGGGHSGLGAGDRVRYDACAVRRAVERVTRAGPGATWTTVPLF